MPRKPTKKGTKERLDRAFSAAMRRRVTACEMCGNPYGLQCHHAIVKRRNHRCRWEPRNIAVLCAQCHDWAETHPVAWGRWMDAHRRDDVDYIMSIKEEKVVYTLTDYQDMLSELKEAA